MSDEAAVESVRHEEVARARTERVVTGRARLQRVVVRERRTIEVEVAREEVRVVIDDLEPGEASLPGTGARSATTVLHEERIEIVRRVVPVERVTLVVDPVAGSAPVAVHLRHEQVEVEADPAVPSGAARSAPRREDAPAVP